jgi:hypothetical protein
MMRDVADWGSDSWGSPDVSYLSAVASLCNDEHTSAAYDYIIDLDDTGFWIGVRHKSSALPDQGWKLHLSAYPTSAETVLLRALPILLDARTSFKVVASRNRLLFLNTGLGALSQIGKFITVYPSADEVAVDLAVRLHAATRDLPGPAVPSDRALAPRSRVSYRYGAFVDHRIQAQTGEILPAVRRSNGDLVPDVRLIRYEPPSDIADPFAIAGLGVSRTPDDEVIAGRFVAIATFAYSPRKSVSLAFDIHGLRRCIIKRVDHNYDDDQGELLDAEAANLALLHEHPTIPNVYQVIHRANETILVMEDLGGRTLEEHLADLRAQGVACSGSTVVRWGSELASILDSVHLAGLVYRDLKPTNIIVNPDGGLRLVDFELAHPAASETYTAGLGTVGYMSPQQLEGARPTVADDVYGLGALMYLIATGAEPAWSPRRWALPDRPIQLMNPVIHNQLAQVIARCLDRDPGRRFSSMREVLDALRSVEYACPEVSLGGEGISSNDSELEARHSDIARQLGESLCQGATPSGIGDGVRWGSLHPTGAGFWSNDLNTGSAGAVLALAELVGATQDRDQEAVLWRGANALVDAARPEGPPMPGLYIGQMGAAAALLRAGQILQDPRLVASALTIARRVARLPYNCPDLFIGTAGRIRMHLWLWEETNDSEQLDSAVHGGEILVEAAEAAGAGVCWRIPSGYGSLSGQAWLGYAHGAAGIADVLLDLFHATGDTRYLQTAVLAGRWLEEKAITIGDGDSAVNWPTSDASHEAAPMFVWCHGAAGVGRLFLHLSTLGVFPEAYELMERAAYTAARMARWADPTQCHGLSGNIEFLLDAFQETGDSRFLREARTLASLLESFAHRHCGNLYWPSEMPTTISPDYMVGYAGVAVCFLRLANFRTQPHQLSRDGFRYCPSRRPSISASRHPGKRG